MMSAKWRQFCLDNNVFNMRRFWELPFVAIALMNSFAYCNLVIYIYIGLLHLQWHYVANVPVLVQYPKRYGWINR